MELVTATVGMNQLNVVLSVWNFSYWFAPTMAATSTRKVASSTEAFRAEKGRGAAAAPHGHKLFMISKTTFDCLCFRTSKLFLY